MFPAGQAAPQAPQWRRSLARSAQLAPTPESPEPAQAVSEGAQVVAHAPRLHTWPAAQARPQAPQWALSVWALTHTPLHTSCDGEHDGPASTTSTAPASGAAEPASGAAETTGSLLQPAVRKAPTSHAASR